MAVKTDSWGRIDRRHRISKPFDPNEVLRQKSWLPFGNGRSYGDVCHNDSGVLLQSGGDDSIIAFNEDTGLLRAQSGLLLRALLIYLANKKWFPPVVPGTQFVTLGGALANDIDGKNHGKMGTFGQHVRSFVLHRSDGSTLKCSQKENRRLFEATIGGMGLTGYVSEIELALMPVASHWVASKNIPFRNLAEFFNENSRQETANHYNVAWIDSLATGDNLGRGVMMVGNHTDREKSPRYAMPRLSVPFTPPVPLVSGVPLRLFNNAYRWSKSRVRNDTVTTPQSFFFPLDALGHWNRLYGPRGLHQHQSAIPETDAEMVVEKLIRTSQQAGAGSFLTVLKRFGAGNSPGLMSFPQPGITLTLDFPNQGERTVNLLNQLDDITIAAGGRVNPYKDQRMSPATFQAGYPQWELLEELRDPRANSNFWKRVTKRRIVQPPAMESGSSTQRVNQARKQDVQKNPVINKLEKGRNALKSESS